jgi:hypothetical protein
VSLTTGRTFGIADALGQFGVTVCTFMTAQGGVRMAQPVPPGTVLSIMEPDPVNTLAAGAEAVRKAMLRGAVTKPAIALVNYCALRARLLGDEVAQREIGDMSKPLAGAPLVGFCSFGEAGLGDDGVSRHANAAISIVVIGTELSHAARVALEAEHCAASLRRRQANSSTAFCSVPANSSRQRNAPRPPSGNSPRPRLSSSMRSRRCRKGLPSMMRPIDLCCATNNTATSTPYRPIS